MFLTAPKSTFCCSKNCCQICLGCLIPVHVPQAITSFSASVLAWALRSFTWDSSTVASFDGSSPFTRLHTPTRISSSHIVREVEWEVPSFLSLCFLRYSIVNSNFTGTTFLLQKKKSKPSYSQEHFFGIHDVPCVFLFRSPSNELLNRP